MPNTAMRSAKPSTSGSSRGVLAPWLALFALAFLAGLMIDRLLATEASPAPQPRAWQLPQAQALKAVSLGYQNLWSVILWMQTVSYYGGHLHDADFDYLAQLLDRVTQLNPLAEHAYFMAAVILPWHTGRIDDASKLLKRAMKVMPDRWEWPYYQGFNYFWFAGDVKRATAMLERAARMDGAPPIIASLALRLRSQAEGLDAALLYLDQLLRQKQDSHMQAMLREQRQRILTEKVLRRIEDQLRRLPERHNDASDLRRLRQRGLAWPDPLPDGGHVVVAADGHLFSSANPQRYRVYESPLMKRRR